MSEAVGTAPQSAQVDKRAVLAIIKALAKARRFVVPHSDIENELYAIIKQGMGKEIKDLDAVMKMINASIDAMIALIDTIEAGAIKHAYLIEDRVIFSLRKLSSKQLRILKEIARLYSAPGYDGCNGWVDTPRQIVEVDNIIHNMVKFWNDPCNGVVRPAEVAYRLAVDYGLNVRKIGTYPYMRIFRYTVYSIEDSVLVKKIPLQCICKEKVWTCEEWEFAEPSDVQNNEGDG
jgi:hypothetical protein